MPGTTPRGALPYPLGTDPPDTDGAVRTLAEAIAAGAVFYAAGTTAQRPAAAATRAGTLWHSTDTGAVDYCTGSAWIALVQSAPTPLGFAELLLHGGA